jgi:hypothetical protein
MSLLQASRTARVVGRARMVGERIVPGSRRVVREDEEG